ncbi:MAG: zinc ribbon domain-containing protein [Anaerolineae bacterium]
MPIYEYRCKQCEETFDKLRSFADADAPVQCPRCQQEGAERMISAFASFSSGARDGSATSAGGNGGCASCQGGSCATCRR